MDDLTNRCEAASSGHRPMPTPGTAGFLSIASQHAIELIDHLDIWSLVQLAPRLNRGTDYRYLTIGQSFVVKLALSLLQKAGITFSRMDSPYEERLSPGSFPILNERLVSLALDGLAPYFQELTAATGHTESWEKSRVARYLTLCYFKPLKRMLELIIVAERLFVNGTEVSIRLQRTGTEQAALWALSGIGIAVSFYRAPFRWRMPARPDYFENENNPWPAQAAIRNLFVWTGALVLSIVGLVRVRRSFKSKGAVPTPEILCLNAKPNPSPAIDDFYWLDALIKEDPAIIWILHSIRPGPEGWKRYADRAGYQATVGDLIRGKGKYFAGIEQFYKRYVSVMIRRGLQIALQTATGKIPVIVATQLLILEERSGFYEALIESTGATLAWSMNEGHELNTQALALAAARKGGLALGTSWSLQDSPNLATSNNRNDVTFVWGTRQKELFENSRVLTKRYIATGYPTTRAALATARKTTDEPETRWLCFYDNVPGTDILVPRPLLEQAYAAVLDVLEADHRYRVIFKTKRSDYRSLSAELVARINGAVAGGRAFIRQEHGDLASGLSADIVSGIGASSLASVAAQWGRPCILFDPEQVMTRWTPTDTPALQRTSDVAEFRAKLLDAMRNAEDMAPRGGGIDAFADVEGDRRTAGYIASLLDALRGGADSEAAIAAADRAYKAKYGASRVFDGAASASIPQESNLNWKERPEND